MKFSALPKKCPFCKARFKRIAHSGGFIKLYCRLCKDSIELIFDMENGFKTETLTYNSIIYRANVPPSGNNSFDIYILDSTGINRTKIAQLPEPIFIDYENIQNTLNKLNYHLAFV